MPILQFETSVPEKLSEGLERRLIHLNNLMTAVIEYTNGPMNQPDPPHSHPHEQISYVADGELYVFIDNERTLLKKGDVFAVPGGVLHCIQALSEYVRLVDSFTPIRQEFLVK